MRVTDLDAAVSRRPPAVGRTVTLAALTTIGTLVLLVTATVVASYGPGLGWILALLAIPLTIGFPTTFAALICISICNSPSLWLLGVLSAVLGLSLQTGAMLLARRLRGPRR